ncbi:MAG: DOMON-like domain-containing protein [Gammaproteobacteria bacterium]
MSWHKLIPHPRSEPGVAYDIVVDVRQTDQGTLLLEYRLRGDLGGIQLPERGKGEFRDGLWQATCFEAYIAASSGGAYWEFNIAPSGDWAVYAFDACREGMRPKPELVPTISWSRSSQDKSAEESAGLLQARLEIDGLSELSRPWKLGLSAVIQEQGGALCYWALTHPSESPDFHHPAGFTLRL